MSDEQDPIIVRRDIHRDRERESITLDGSVVTDEELHNLRGIGSGLGGGREDITAAAEPVCNPPQDKPSASAGRFPWNAVTVADFQAFAEYLALDGDGAVVFYSLDGGVVAQLDNGRTVRIEPGASAIADIVTEAEAEIGGRLRQALEDARVEVVTFNGRPW